VYSQPAQPDNVNNARAINNLRMSFSLCSTIIYHYSSIEFLNVTLTGALIYGKVYYIFFGDSAFFFEENIAAF
jgi:hypothetical protein